MGRIVRLHRLGGPEELRLETAEPDGLRAGEVLIRVQAIGLNNSEAQLRRGDYPMLKASLPTRIGRECTGIVEAAGEGVAMPRPGARVSTIPAFDVQRHGVYGEWCIVPAVATVPVPAGLPVIEAAAIWQQYLTAFGPLVEHGRVAAGETVLVTAGASSVGLGAIQMARLLGARVIATTRSPGKRETLLRAGAEQVVVTGEEDLAGRIGEITAGRGFDLALDPVAGPNLAALAEAAATEARIFLYGQLSADPAPFPLIPVLRKGLTLRGYTLWEITLNAARRERAIRFILEHVEAGRLRPVIDRVFRLDEIVEAHRYLESGRQAGKIVVRTDGWSE
ncbi:MAG: zinc-dependent alcohol dehydrogenase family protein [Alphaproteobacteria bacterium]|nr:zinc-dependent alcohol dehydrogenase family protein [Alphaproteobacteria bacterium]